MNILVTGGCGYIGMSLCLRLQMRGHKVRAVDWSKLVFPKLPFEFYRADAWRLGDKDAAWPDAVIHLAGYSLAECEKDWAATRRNNIELTAHLVKEFPEARFVFASTCSVYGVMPRGEKATTRTPPNPKGPYAESKLEAETYVAAHANAVILRFGTVMGYAPVMRFDTLINGAAQAVYRDDKITIYSPDSWRPFLALSSAVNALVIASVLERDISPGIYNVVSTNIQKSRVGELVKAAGGKIEETTGGDVRDYAVELLEEGSPFYKALPPRAESWESLCFGQILTDLAEDEREILCPSLQ